MIPIELQDELAKRLKSLFKETRLKNPKGDMVPLNVYTQHLPVKNKNNLSSEFPYILIRLADGSDSDPQESQTAKILFIAGVFDRDDSHQGYRDAISIIQKTYESLKRNPVIDARFEMKYPINWAYHDEDSEPYFFAGLETNWEVPKALREDVEAMI